MTDRERIAALERQVQALTECTQVLIAAIRAMHEPDTANAQLSLAQFSNELIDEPVTEWRAVRSMLTNTFFSASLPDEVKRLFR